MLKCHVQNVIKKKRIDKQINSQAIHTFNNLQNCDSSQKP